MNSRRTRVDAFGEESDAREHKAFGHELFGEESDAREHQAFGHKLGLSVTPCRLGAPGDGLELDQAAFKQIHICAFT